MSQNEFIGFVIGSFAVIVPLCVALIKPITENTKTMTRLTDTMEHLIDRMDKQEKALEKHEMEFDDYKEKVRASQKRQWDKIDELSDDMIRVKQKQKEYKEE